jgi:hypothetical protein
MIAGAAASQDAAPADDLMKTRRLTGTIVMTLPRSFLVCAAIVAAAVCGTTV